MLCFREMHFLSTLLMEHVALYFNHAEKQIRNKVVRLIQQLLVQQLSAVVQSGKKVLPPSRVVGLYFPLVPLVKTENFPLFCSFGSNIVQVGGAIP
jgi:hypothetical protein